MQRRKIRLISNIIQAGQPHYEVFDCEGYVDSNDQKVYIEFDHPHISGQIEVFAEQATLTYHKPHPNQLHFNLRHSTHANYHSQYGVMALIVDTKQIRKDDRHIYLHYDLLQTHFKVGEYRIEMIFQEDTPA